MNNIFIIILAAAIALWNIITFALYAADKRRAAKKQWRISEATLIACAFLMGGIGAMLGMNLLRHKTHHVKFKLLVPIAVVLNIAIVVAALWFTGALS